MLNEFIEESHKNLINKAIELGVVKVYACPYGYKHYLNNSGNPTMRAWVCIVVSHNNERVFEDLVNFKSHDIKVYDVLSRLEIKYIEGELHIKHDFDDFGAPYPNQPHGYCNWYNNFEIVEQNGVQDVQMKLKEELLLFKPRDFEEDLKNVQGFLPDKKEKGLVSQAITDSGSSRELLEKAYRLAQRVNIESYSSYGYYQATHPVGYVWTKRCWQAFISSVEILSMLRFRLGLVD